MRRQRSRIRSSESVCDILQPRARRRSSPRSTAAGSGAQSSPPDYSKGVPAEAEASGQRCAHRQDWDAYGAGFRGRTFPNCRCTSPGCMVDRGVEGLSRLSGRRDSMRRCDRLEAEQVGVVRGTTGHTANRRYHLTQNHRGLEPQRHASSEERAALRVRHSPN